MLHKFQENFTKGFVAYRRGMEDPQYRHCRSVRYLSDNSHAQGYVAFQSCVDSQWITVSFSHRSRLLRSLWIDEAQDKLNFRAQDPLSGGVAAQDAAIYQHGAINLPLHHDRIEPICRHRYLLALLQGQTNRTAMPSLSVPLKRISLIYQDLFQS